MSLIKLKIILLFKKLFHILKRNFFLIAFGLLLFIFCFIKWYLIIIYFGYLFYVYKKNKNILILIIIISIIFLFSYYLNLYYIKKEVNEFTGIVLGIKEEENYNKLTILKGLNKIVAIDSEKNPIEVSDRVFIIGGSKDIQTEKLEYGYNYYEYLIGIRCNNLINIKSIDYSNSINPFVIRKLLIRYINNHFEGDTNYYIQALILGDNSNINTIDSENIKINGISHLFAISGLHISLIVSLINKLLNLFKMSDKKKEIIIVIFLVIYLFITNFSPSVLRASSLYIFNLINKNKKLNLSSLDIISILFIIFVIINPVFIYNLSFKLSFLASFFIIVFSNIFKKIKSEYNINSILELIIITFVLQICTLPIVININNKINITSIITNSIFIIYMSYILLPLLVFTLFIPILKYPLGIVIKIFSLSNNFVSSYLKLNINLPHLSPIEIFIYYGLLIIIIYLIKNKSKVLKYSLFSFFICFIIYYNKSNLNYYTKVSFLALHEGESTIIDLPFGKGVIIIDTGTGEGNTLSKYLISHGIRKIDCLILTHNHSDHNGEAEYLIDNFKVKDVLVSVFDDSNIRSTKRIKKGDVLDICGITFNIYNPYESNSDKNYESIVFTCNIECISYLFLGDAPKEIEEELIGKINSVDIVKVGHHGSNTSTSLSFYKSINPSICIIMSGEIKYYNFPNKEVIDTLKDYNVFRTDINYEIIIKSKNRKIKIKTIKE